MGICIINQNKKTRSQYYVMDKYQFDYIGFQTDNNNFELHITNLNAINVYRISPNINSGIGRHTFIKSNVLHIYYMKTI